MLKLKIHNNKWRIEIENEEWEFENKNDFENVLNDLIRFKEKFGKIK